MINFFCKTCGKFHDDIPAFGIDRPHQYHDVPIRRRETDVFLTSDSCVIADKFFFVRGCLDIKVIDADRALSFGAWVSLREDNFLLWQSCYESPMRDHVGPFFGWLCTSIPCYESTLNLKTMAHLRNESQRPCIVLEPSNHRLSLDFHSGITLDRAMLLVHSLQDDTGIVPDTLG